MKKAPLLFEDLPRDQPKPLLRTRRGVAAVVGIFLATRLVAWTAAYTGASLHFRLEHRLDPPFEKHVKALTEKLADEKSPEHRSYQRRLANLAPLLQFDGQHYASIINGGYRYAPVAPDGDPVARQQNIAFFPLYPLICQPLAEWLGTPGAMILVAHAAGLAAALLLYFWICRRIDEPVALLAVALVFCLPEACYYVFGYAESLLLLLIVLTLILLERQRFWLAALTCGLATATRPTAIGLVGVLLLAYWMNNPAPRPRRLAALLPLALVGAFGILCYAGYLTHRFGSPLVYLANFRVGWVPDDHRADWLQYLTLARVWDQFKYIGRALAGLPVGLVELTNPFFWNMLINLFVLFLSLAGLPRVPRSFRPLLALGPFIFFQSYLASGGASFGVEPISRYMAAAVPAFVVWAAWCIREWRPAARTALMAGLLLIQAAWAFRFGLGEWSS